jgi:hypothetical protein
MLSSTDLNFKSHSDFVSSLVSLFPDFAAEVELDDPQSHHDVLLSFSLVSARLLAGSGQKTIERFCDLVNRMVAAGGQFENAISTCLLEHASQCGIRRLIQPYLSKAAKAELR